jgi:dihydrofolate reductase
MIIGIVAIAQNFAIGKDGKLPWHYSADLKFFRQTTMGNALVMGSRTWNSIGKALPGRLNIILSRSEAAEAHSDAVFLRHSDEVLTLSRYLNCDVFIIGGARTFETFADVIEKWIVTTVPVSVPDADTFMPDDFLKGFIEADSIEIGDGLRVQNYIRK